MTSTDKRPAARAQSRSYLKAGIFPGTGGSLIGRYTSIATRVVVGFAFLTLLQIVIAAMSWSTLTTVGQDLTSIGSAIDRSTAASDMEQSIGKVWPEAEEAMLAGSQEHLTVALKKGQAAIRLVGMPDAERDFSVYSQAMTAAELASETVAQHRAALQSLDASFDPAFAALLSHRKLIFDADGAVALADIQANVSSGQLLLTRFISDTGPTLLASRSATLPKDAKDLQAVWTSALTKVKSLAAASADPEEKQSFDRLLDATSAYAQGVDALVPILLNRTELRLGKIDTAEKDVAARAQHLSLESRTNQRQIVDEAVSLGQSSSIAILTVSGVSIVIGLLAGGLIAWSIVGPLRGITGAMKRVAEGRTDVDIPARDERGEIGTLAKALDVFKTNLSAMRRMEDEAHIARQTEEAERNALAETLSESFHRSITSILQTVRDAIESVDANAGRLLAASTSTRSSVGEAGKSVEACGARVEEVAAATGEFSSAIQEIAERTDQSVQLTIEAVNLARKTDAVVNGLASAADRIGEITGLIGDIAEKTNLLALNASIEAARAGDAGRGFSVVASEVKSLASQTQQATHQISDQIAAMQSAVANTAAAMRAIGAQVGEINGHVTGIASGVEEQSSVTLTIAGHAREAARNTHIVGERLVTVERDADMAQSAAEQTRMAADNLRAQAASLTAESERFVERLGAMWSKPASSA
jgi:methyl-accepting chemotaxis protein